MTGRGITIVGLGPAGAEYLTREAWAHLKQCGEIWLRTKFHPAVAGLPEGLGVRSFDEIYDSKNDIGEVLETIVQQVMELGRREQGVTYGVPGSPFVAEETVSELMKAVEASDLPIRLIDGLSFIEPVCSALGIDLHPQMVLADALHLASLEVPLSPDHPGHHFAVGKQLRSQRAQADSHGKLSPGASRDAGAQRRHFRRDRREAGAL